MVHLQAGHSVQLLVGGEAFFPALVRAIEAAREEIRLETYIFHDDPTGAMVLEALEHAARRGVKVRVLLQGRYEHFMSYHAARPVYGSLLAAGIELHEYAPSFLHAKVAVIDANNRQPWVTVGSSNLDPLSLLLAREANVVAVDGVFARDLKARLELAMVTQGRRLEQALFAQRTLWSRALDWLAYGLMRFALALTGKRY